MQVSTFFNFMKRTNPKVQEFVEIGGEKFTKLEAKLMDEVRTYGEKTRLETPRVIDKKGKLADLNYLEDFTNCSVIGKNGIKLFGKDLGLLGLILEPHLKTVNSTYIHDHLRKVPLSAVDVKTMMDSGIRKIIATTPHNGFSYMEQPKVNPFTYGIRHIKTKDAVKELYKKQSELGLNQANILQASPKEIKKYSDDCIKLLEKFAEKTGFKFKHNLK